MLENLHNFFKVMCQGIPACEYDYLMTGRREIGLDTLGFEKKFEDYKHKGEIKRK